MARHNDDEGQGMKGRVFAIHRFAVHDGPGIRTAVFLKGCPLRCLWCHNPESFDLRPEIAFIAHRCEACGDCVPACPVSAHRFEDGHHVFDRFACRKCGRCAEACVFGALERTGMDMTVEEVVCEVLKDSVFYSESGGGVTVSGGEPLSQWRFVRELLSDLKARGIQTAVETSGFGPRNALEPLVPVTDLFLFDIKAVNSEKHRKLTGVPNDSILDNLEFLAGAGVKVELRCPLVPGLNDSKEDVAAIAALVRKYPGLAGAVLLPYHNTGNDKYVRYAKLNRLPGLASADQTDRSRWSAIISSARCGKIRIA
jgi:glycyl-radical enzyme activating protein